MPCCVCSDDAMDCAPESPMQLSLIFKLVIDLFDVRAAAKKGAPNLPILVHDKFSAFKRQSLDDPMYVPMGCTDTESILFDDKFNSWSTFGVRFDSKILKNEETSLLLKEQSEISK